MSTARGLGGIFRMDAIAILKKAFGIAVFEHPPYSGDKNTLATWMKSGILALHFPRRLWLRQGMV